ncbi:isoprenoid synthase domain-containing protein [Crucibulum laeve]|uniref:Terpene synthase n=1 Tax=Crucibulum laeve TaxID=68775 RepID=A0A5C3LPG1_9AGAR|nr:isoprenoid synthase domain-containing protein [Crucibulum laeve]
MDALNSISSFSISSIQPGTDRNDLPPKPTFRSNLPLLTGKDHTAAIAFANQYFASNWPWKNMEEYQSFLTKDMASWGAFASPDILEDRMETCALICVVGFLLDDAIEACTSEQVHRFASRFKGLVFGTIAPENQMESAIADIHGRMRATDSQGNDSLQFAPGEKYCEECYRWLTHSMGLGRANPSTCDSLDNYLKHRVTDVGVIWGMSFIDWAYNIQVPQHIQDDPYFKEMILTGGFHGLLANDLYSYRREVLEARTNGSNGTLMNSISVVMHEQYMEENDAIKFIEDRLRTLEASFPEIEAKLYSGYTGEDAKFCERYAMFVKGLYRGNADWSANIYSSKDNTLSSQKNTVAYMSSYSSLFVHSNTLFTTAARRASELSSSSFCTTIIAAADKSAPGANHTHKPAHRPPLPLQAPPLPTTHAVALSSSHILDINPPADVMQQHIHLRALVNARASASFSPRPFYSAKLSVTATAEPSATPAVMPGSKISSARMLSAGPALTLCLYMFIYSSSTTLLQVRVTHICVLKVIAAVKLAERFSFYGSSNVFVFFANEPASHS